MKTKRGTSPTQAKMVASSHRAGWPVRDWCDCAGISDALLYKLDEARRPVSVKIGRKRLIVEAPGEWLRRMAEASSPATAGA
jgi:hypothetical protein